LNTPPAPVALTPYVKSFILAFLFVLFVLIIIQFFVMELPSAMGIISLMAAGSIPIQKFATDHRREMLRRERVTFATQCAIISTVMSVGLFVLSIFLGGGLQDVGLGGAPWWVAPLLIIISFVISWLILYFEAGFMVKFTLKNLAKQK
jgi:hypothetical protein